MEDENETSTAKSEFKAIPCLLSFSFSSSLSYSLIILFNVEKDWADQETP